MSGKIIEVPHEIVEDDEINLMAQLAFVVDYANSGAPFADSVMDRIAEWFYDRYRRPTKRAADAVHVCHFVLDDEHPTYESCECGKIRRR